MWISQHDATERWVEGAFGSATPAPEVSRKPRVHLTWLQNAVDDLMHALVIQRTEQGAFELHAATLHRSSVLATSLLQSIAILPTVQQA